MRKAIIMPEHCKNCPVCLVEQKCAGSAIIRENADDKPWIDFYQCRGCMKCLQYCQNNAVGEIIQPCH